MRQGFPLIVKVEERASDGDDCDKLSTPVYRNASHPDGLVSGLQDGSVRTCWDLFQIGVKTGERPFLGVREVVRTSGGKMEFGSYKWMTYKEGEHAALRVGTALLRGGYVPQLEFPEETYPQARNLRLLGIYCKNCAEWLLCEQAANAYGFTLIPLYDTLGDEALTHILKKTRLTTVVASRKGLQSIRRLKSAHVKHVILTDVETEWKGEENEETTSTDIAVVHWSELLETASDDLMEVVQDISPDDVQTICFTSGTTGTPKGVIMTHRNICACVCAAMRGPFLDPSIVLDAQEAHISYLPLAHTFERIICNVVYSQGARLGVYSGDVLRLMDDIRELEPTVFIAVPQIYNRIDQRVSATLREKNRILKWCFNFAMNRKLSNLKKYNFVENVFWDSLFFRRPKSLLGNRVKCLLSGGAPMDPVTQDRMKCLFSCPMVEGYGMTETLGASFCALPSMPSGCVGAPLPCLEFKLVSVPEMGYFVEGERPRGELLMRGPSVTPGYFLNPSETSAALSSDGWLRSGDIVELLPNGALKIIDRKKNIFKLAQGEYVAVESVEAAYLHASLVAQIFVYGYSTKSVLVAIVVPDSEAARCWGRSRGLTTEECELNTLCSREEFKQAVLQSMTEVDSVLKGFEKVKSIRLSPVEFSPENGILTPTFKLRRQDAFNIFKEKIDAMYSELTLHANK